MPCAELMPDAGPAAPQPRYSCRKLSSVRVFTPGRHGPRPVLKLGGTFADGKASHLVGFAGVGPDALKSQSPAT